ncbi:FMN-dependent NADH-azoreductase [Chryseobacterium arachidis]|uniref:FMN dependent NADH:quinone oxidoreductase n=1 Tax=Chryseobacterium arachidis TaxID=1416778 RepID=A0A1M5G6G8_9FLAO|nr:NAD(P)H-dependent oxidoreductase [Chryseobacterium arachidis]SHF99387.1 FMN-dependent NADH-azoreductase [Chryseobacterium arachidis]
MKILHIDCSIRNEYSISRKLSKLMVEQLQNFHEITSVDYLDLSTDSPNHITECFIEGVYTVPEERTAEMLKELEQSDEYIHRLHDADIYVIGMPMYNFSIPSNFKAFIDLITRTGRTFRGTEHGFEGLLVNKKVYVINTRGVDFSNEIIASFDHLQPYLKSIFRFIGLTDVHFVNVFPVKWGNKEKLESAIYKAEQEIAEAAHNLLLLQI